MNDKDRVDMLITCQGNLIYMLDDERGLDDYNRMIALRNIEKMQDEIESILIK